MQDTWATRELPVLDATVSLLEESYMVTVSDIATRTGLDSATVARSLEALDPVYVDFRKTTTGGDPTFWYVLKVTPQARRAVGQWPTPDSFVTKLAAELSAAASQEADVERKGLLSYAARLIGDTVRAAAVRAAGEVLAPALGPPDPATPQLSTPSTPAPPAPHAFTPATSTPSTPSGSGPATPDPATPRPTDSSASGKSTEPGQSSGTDQSGGIDQSGGTRNSRSSEAPTGSARLTGERLTPPGPWVTRVTS